jgi:hypothetical protein
MERLVREGDFERASSVRVAVGKSKTVLGALGQRRSEEKEDKEQREWKVDSIDLRARA